MLMRVLILSLGFGCSAAVWSFPCHYTLVKDSCWIKYNVSVDVVDPATTKKLLTITVPAGKSWARDVFDCHPAQGLIYFAQFSPVFWKNDEGKKYQGLKDWFLPGSINPGDTAWTINICYPKDFAQVPFPPEADGNCKCDFSEIPPVEPK